MLPKNRLTRVDEDGVPKLVQNFEEGANQMVKIALFDGRTLYMPSEAIFSQRMYGKPRTESDLIEAERIITDIMQRFILIKQGVI